MPPHWQGVLWGILPFGSSLLAILVVFIPEKRREEAAPSYSAVSDEELMPRRMVS
jgi:hypothetical protein